MYSDLLHFAQKPTRKNPSPSLQALQDPSTTMQNPRENNKNLKTVKHINITPRKKTEKQTQSHQGTRLSKRDLGVSGAICVISVFAQLETHSWRHARNYMAFILKGAPQTRLSAVNFNGKGDTIGTKTGIIQRKSACLSKAEGREGSSSTAQAQDLPGRSV